LGLMETLSINNSVGVLQFNDAIERLGIGWIGVWLVEPKYEHVYRDQLDRRNINNNSNLDITIFCALESRQNVNIFEECYSKRLSTLLTFKKQEIEIQTPAKNDAGVNYRRFYISSSRGIPLGMLFAILNSNSIVKSLERSKFGSEG
jgi:hypothetical protein